MFDGVKHLGGLVYPCDFVSEGFFSKDLVEDEAGGSIGAVIAMPVECAGCFEDTFDLLEARYEGGEVGGGFGGGDGV